MSMLVSYYIFLGIKSNPTTPGHHVLSLNPEQRHTCRTTVCGGQRHTCSTAAPKTAAPKKDCHVNVVVAELFVTLSEHVATCAKPFQQRQ
jgi:hypothetical protein